MNLFKNSQAFEFWNMKILLFFQIFETCMTLLYTKQTDMRLTGHVIGQESRIGPAMCTMECLRQKQCKSVNYNRNGLFCELNDSNSTLSSGSMTLTTGYDYLELNVYQQIGVLDVDFCGPYLPTILGVEGEQNGASVCLTSNPCPVGSMCTDTKLGGYTCPAIVCLTDPSAVSNAVIQVTSRSIGDTLTYVCDAGYTASGSLTTVCGADGQWSQTTTVCENVNECDSSPCLNGGTCVDGTSAYQCTCASGYTDVNCQTDVNECDSSPCLNGGTCVDGASAYQCTCVSGYTDVNCQTDINECSSNPCQNGGSCTDNVNGYTCACPAGLAGTNCQTDINECSSNPCQNGGSCSDNLNGYVCACPAGIAGTNCQTDINECSSNPCQNGGSCTDNVNGYVCSCPAGIAGTYCQTDINECSSNPCQNGGTCNDNVNGYTCACATGISGIHCDSITMEGCLTMSNCWVKRTFTYDNIFNGCSGDQYVTQTTYNPGKYLGVILCNTAGSRYKFFLSDSLDSQFKNIGDGSGHGEDHCELVGASDSSAIMAGDYTSSPTCTGFYRSSRGGSFSYGTIGYASTSYYFNSWQQCGVNIPGSSIVIQAK